jgi:putative redox protein
LCRFPGEFDDLVGEGGFEPPTTSTQSSCTTGLCDSPSNTQSVARPLPPRLSSSPCTVPPVDGATPWCFDASAMIDSETETPNAFPQVLHVRKHTFRADVNETSGSLDSAPGPHDYFDASLAACKALTVTWFAKKNQIPLERVEAHVERDDKDERTGKYVLRVRLAFHGNLTPEQRERLYAVAGKCPIHRLMTTTDVLIETAPLEASL